jgi:hypothetical protein
MYSYCYVCSVYCLCVYKSVLYYCHRVSIQLQLADISYSIHLFEMLKGEVVQMFVSRKIGEVLVRYHWTNESEETDCYKLQLLLCQGRSMLMPLSLWAMFCKLST